MNVLALDLATKTGWAIKTDEGIESGMQDFSPKRGESSGMRYLMFRRWLQGMGKVDLIMYEQNFRRGGHASEVAAGFSTRVQEHCAEHVIEYGQVNAMTLKKWATGSGKADKRLMKVRALELRWPERRLAVGMPLILDDNEADAICLLFYTVKEIVGENACNARSAVVHQTVSTTP